MDVLFSLEPDLRAEEFQAVLRASTLAERRPADDLDRLNRMLRQADLVVTARLEGRLIGISRALTDFSYCTYLSDLAVAADVQRRGVGRRLIALTHEHAGRETTLVLLAAPAARDYYPHVGLARHDSCWIAARAE